MLAKQPEGLDLVATTQVLRAKTGNWAFSNYERGCLGIALCGGLHTQQRTAKASHSSTIWYKCRRRHRMGVVLSAVAD